MAGKPKASGEVAKKLVENLNTDLRTLSSECRRKYPPVKEAAESGLLKIRQVMAKSQDNMIAGLVSVSVEILQPFVLGCDTKNTKVVHLCLTSIQRLISHEAISMPAANNVINILWVLMEAGIEELKLLQTAILLLTTNSVVQHESLAKALVLCFRLHFTKDSTTINTAAATVRQLVSVVFERVVAEDAIPSQQVLDAMSTEELKAVGRHPPRSLRPCAGDAFLLFQDFCQLVNADQPHWLVGMTEMTRTFGLELMEAVLTSFPTVFLNHPEFSFLLKERVCPLVIKLFSPSLKYRPGVPAPPSPSLMDKPYFPIVMRLLRIVAVLLKHYYKLLVTECEIFLSLLVKFLDPEKPMWQRACALEVLSRLCAQPHLLKSFCESYDMKQHSTKIFRDIVNGLGTFIQSQFIGQQAAPQHPQSGSKAPDISGQPPAMVGGMPVGSGVTPQPAFYYRGIWIPLVVNIAATQGSQKAVLRLTAVEEGPLGTMYATWLLDMVDKIDPPTVPEGYGLSLAFLCMLDVVRCVQGLIEKTMVTANPTPQQEQDAAAITSLNVELITSSWCGVLAALSLLLDASTDESATEAILKAEQSYANLCGQLELTTPRDAFITALCKASLPPHYTLTVLNAQGAPPTGLQRGHSGGAGRNGDMSSGQGSEIIQGSQVVAVGTPLPTASLPLGAQQGPVMLTAKNIQCMRAILMVAHCHGSILGSAWHMVLTTLQHLVWILGLKPSTGGSLRAAQQASDSPNAVITTAVMADLPVLSSMLSRLFESSQYLDDVALHHLIDALCKLSSEAMELAYSNREPSLFAVAKLLETGLVNLKRVNVLWRPVTAHLLEVCQHPHLGMRSWGAEAITSLTKAVLAHKFEPPLHEQPKLQGMLLAPLQELSSIMHPDMRQKQLECVLQILHKNGETLGQGWPLVLGVIGAVTNDQGENLVRIAFQSLQLVVTDFLPIMPSSCLQVCVDVAGRFGRQEQELNISLTAIGLMWNISDYFYQNREKIIEDLTREAAAEAVAAGGGGGAAGKGPAMPPFDALWMCLYSRLGDLCVDSRPAVRKSAGQTLFSTIAAHGVLLQQSTWQIVLWMVLFPLLDKVKKHSSSASDIKDNASGNILIHHSRDTAEKQWAETRVLTLAGVARVFNTKRKILHQLGDFPRAWALLLEFIESAALCRNAEVSLAALKSFQEILQINKDSRDTRSAEWKLVYGNKKMEVDAPPDERITRTSGNGDGDDDGSGAATRDRSNSAAAAAGDVGGVESPGDAKVLWSNAWRVWLSIGTMVTIPPEVLGPNSTSASASADAEVYVPSQPFLTALVQIFPALYAHIKTRFVAADLQKLSTVLQRALAVPVHSDSTPFILPVGEVELTTLQGAILGAIQVLQKGMSNESDEDLDEVFDSESQPNSQGMSNESDEDLDEFVDSESQLNLQEVQSGSDTLPTMYPDLFDQLLTFSEYAVKPPKFGKMDTRSVGTKGLQSADWVAMNYVPFAERVIELVVELYATTATHPAVISEHVLQRIIKTFRLSLSLKYGCPSQTTWMLTINSLLSVLSVGLPIARKHDAAFHGMWSELGLTIEEFLFSQHPPPATLSVEDYQRDETIDCKVVQLIRDDIMPYATNMPSEFVIKIMSVLNKGSIHSATTSAFIDTDSSRKLREDFAKACFETLLQFSFITRTSSASDAEEGTITKLAVTALLQRCQEVLRRYVEDERLSGKCPLPRPRMSEMAFVLKAVSTLLVTLKRAPQGNVEASIWSQVISLYPALVECTTSTSPQVCKALRGALQEYKDLLAPPTGPSTANGL